MAPKKKTKTGDTLNSRLALVMKSGKVVLGYKSTLKGKSSKCVSVYPKLCTLANAPSL